MKSRMFGRRLRLAASTAVLVALVGGADAWAQSSAGNGAAPGGAPAEQPTGAGDNTIGEVVVTAQFRSQSVQKTPLAITAVNAAMLEQRSQTSIEQVANQAPNVTLKPQGAAFGPSLGASIRGVGQYDFDPALEPGVGLYVDDVYYPTLTGSILDLLDLDRVEIARGPQGTLSGKNSIGGSIKLYGKKPTGSGDGYLQATYGGLNRVEARGSVDFALVPDKLFLRLAAVTKRSDGYVNRYDYACKNPGSGLPTMTSNQSCLLGKEGGKDYSAVRANLRWLASEKVEFNLIGDFTSDRSENPATVLVATRPLSPGGDALTAINGVHYGDQFVTGGHYYNYASFYSPAGTLGPFHADALSADDKSRYTGWGVSGTIDWTIAPNLALKSITAYRGYTSDWNEDNDVSPLPLGLGIEHLSHRQFSEELRLNGQITDNIQYTVGGFYFWENTTYATHQDLWYPGIILDFLGDDPVIAKTKAGFAQLSWNITDKLTLIGGLRYTTDDKSYQYTRINPDGSFNPVVGPLNGQVGKFSGDRWDYRANLGYQWTPNILTYAQISTGFKGGGVNPRPFVVAQVQPFGPEKLTAYEVGFKSQFFDRVVTLNGSAFFNKYKDIQLTVLSCPQFGGPGPCALPVNAGNADVKGVEFETAVHPMGGLEFDGSVSYLDFKYTKIDPTTGVQFGMRTPYNPKWKWSGGVQYEFPVGNVGTLTPRFDVAYQSSIYTNAINGPLNKIDHYALANARLTYANNEGGWETALEVTNLFDKYYYVTKFDLTGAGGGSAGGSPGLPREWAITVKKRF